jgi:hypothetical protein
MQPKMPPQTGLRIHRKALSRQIKRTLDSGQGLSNGHASNRKRGLNLEKQTASQECFLKNNSTQTKKREFDSGPKNLSDAGGPMTKIREEFLRIYEDHQKLTVEIRNRVSPGTAWTVEELARELPEFSKPQIAGRLVWFLFDAQMIQVQDAYRRPPSVPGEEFSYQWKLQTQNVPMTFRHLLDIPQVPEVDRLTHCSVRCILEWFLSNLGVASQKTDPLSWIRRFGKELGTLEIPSPFLVDVRGSYEEFLDYFAREKNKS